MTGKPLSPQKEVAPLLLSFAPLFYVCKGLGIYPHDVQAFHQETRLKKSVVGSFVVICVMILLFVCFNLMLYAFQESNSFQDAILYSKDDQLTLVVGGVLTYIGLASCFADQITAIRQQQNVGSIFDRIQCVDEDLHGLGITVDNSGLLRRNIVVIVASVFFEGSTFLASSAMLTGVTEWAWLWVFSSVPTLYNSFDKIWFTSLILALHQRFAAINDALEQMVQRHEQIQQSRLRQVNVQYVQVQQLAKELPHSSKVAPSTLKNVFGDLIPKQPKQRLRGAPAPKPVYESELQNVEQLEEKFVLMCQLHNDICDIAKLLNTVWSIPLLFLLAYGFLSIAATLYFLYSAANDQNVLSLYRNAQFVPISVFYVAYIAAKCVSVMFNSWKTTQECKRTGICLHKCAVAANTNKVYEIVNHLSLKLLHHGIDFSASEFLTLDMKTLFTICGGLTSYLIIFIQFDVAAHQAKSAAHANSTNNSIH